MLRTFTHLLFLCTCCLPTLGKTWTFDFTQEKAVMGGTAEGFFETRDYRPNQGPHKGTTQKVLRYSQADGDTPYWQEKDTDELYQAINDAIAGKKKLIIRGSVSTGSTVRNRRATILHAGPDGKGISLGIHGDLLVMTKGNINHQGIHLGHIPHNSDQYARRYLTDFVVTIGAGGELSCSINGEVPRKVNGKVQPDWGTPQKVNYQYSIGCLCPDTEADDFYLGKYDTCLANFSIESRKMQETERPLLFSMPEKTSTGHFFGFAFCMNNKEIHKIDKKVNFAEVDAVYLDSLAFATSEGTGNPRSIKISVYEHKGKEELGTYVGCSAPGKKKDEGSIEFTFPDSLQISPHRVYQYLFVKREASDTQLASPTGYRKAAVTRRIDVTNRFNGAWLPRFWGTYQRNTVNSYAWQDMPVFTLRSDRQLISVADESDSSLLLYAGASLLLLIGGAGTWFWSKKKQG